MRAAAPEIGNTEHSRAGGRQPYLLGGSFPF